MFYILIALAGQDGQVAKAAGLSRVTQYLREGLTCVCLTCQHFVFSLWARINAKVTMCMPDNFIKGFLVILGAKAQIMDLMFIYFE